MHSINMNSPFLLYGSYGYTSSLIADLAVKRGMQPILSGRDANRLKTQADRLNLESIPISLSEPGALEAALKAVPLVLNCAGPFRHTFKPVVEACMRVGRHYLDITGEIQVFEALALRDDEARRAGVMLLPGIGFDVVPTDCLAAHLKQRLPFAITLTLAISTSGGGLSRGTLLTTIQGLPGKGIVRRDGKLVQVPMFGKTRVVDFGRGPRTAINIPWGDVSTAYFSTGIPNIENYITVPKSVIRMTRLIRPLIGITSRPAVQRILRWAVKRSRPGPTTEERSHSRSRIWGEVKDNLGHTVISRMETPDGYTLTAETALAAVERVLSGDFKPGFQTPSLAYGADFILDFNGVKREDIHSN
jgi:short subunit dehydrogenase-like uncharacterized protein